MLSMNGQGDFTLTADGWSAPTMCGVMIGGSDAAASGCADFAPVAVFRRFGGAEDGRGA